MNRQSIWEALGIEATGDLRSIKKAYAARLKQTNPEADGEGFKVLRAAYESALRYAQFAAYREQIRSEGGQDVLERDGAPETETVAAEVQSDAPVAPPDAVQPGDREDEAGVPPPDAQSLSPAEQEELEHQRACNAFLAALDSGMDTESVLNPLTDVLTGSAMGNLHTFHRTEVWLANVLMQHRSGFDLLFDRLARHFHWNADDSDWKTHAFLKAIFSWRAHVAEQNARDAFLARISYRRHEFHRGYRMLTKPMEERWWLERQWCKRHTRVVRRLIEHISLKVPQAEESLNREALAWWNEHIVMRNEPMFRYARFAVYGLLWLFFVGIIGGIIGLTLDKQAFDSVASLRDRSQRAPQDRSLAADLCRIATQSAPGTGQADPTSDTEAGKTENENRLKVAAAVLDCNRALALVPNSLMARQWRAINYLKLEQWPEAIADFQAISAVSPSDPYALYGRGVAYRAQGQAELGMSLMRSALTVDLIVGEQLRQFKVAGVPVAGVVPGTEPSMPARTLPKFDTPAKIVRHATQQDMEAAHRFFGVPMTLEGKVELECLVSKTGGVSNCLILSEKPFHTPMGEVAIKLAESMGGQPALFRGQPVDLAPVRISNTFQRGGTGALNPVPAPSVVAGPNLVRTPVSSNPPAAPVAPNSLAGSAVPPPVAAPAPDPIAALRARSERAPQDRSLATELCRAATLDAPSLGATGGAASKTTVGGVADNRKKLDAAIADCGRALALAPESLMTRQRRAVDYLKSENWAQALEDFRGIAAVSPNDPVALFGQGLALRAQGNAARGTELMASALSVDPTVQDYLRQLKLAGIPAADVVAGTAPPAPAHASPKADTEARFVRYAEKKDVDAALQYFGLPMTLTDTVSLECLVSKEGAVSQCLIVSERPYNTGMGEMAIKIAESLGGQPARFEGQPVDLGLVMITNTFQTPPGKDNGKTASVPVAAPTAPDPVATLRARSGRAPQNRPVAVELCRVATLDSSSLRATGDTASTAGADGGAANQRKLDAAVADCGRALTLAPESLMTRQRRAIDYLKSEKWAQALEDFRAISAASPNDPVALFGQGLALRAQGDSARGVELMGSALAVDPTVQEYLAQFKLAGVPAANVVAGIAPPSAARPAPRADTAAKIVRRADQKDLDAALRYFGLTTTLTDSVSLECLVSKEGAVSHCLILSEKSFNTGMGELAIKTAESLGAEPALFRGQPVDQAPVRYTYNFQQPSAKDDAKAADGNK